MAEKQAELQNRRPLDYHVYEMTHKEWTGYVLLAACGIFAVAFIFYHSVLLSLLMATLALFYPKIKTQQLIEKRKLDLNLQFKDMIYSLSSSMSAGRSLESSFKEVQKDLQIIYPMEGTYILEEVEYILKNLEMNERIEDLLYDFANRSHLEDVKNFVDVIQSCRKAGGNMVEVIRTTTHVINDKIEIKNEIDTMIAEKKFEQKLMTMAPIGMILVLSMAAPDYMEPVFTTIQGKVVMTVAMMILAITHFISQKIMKISV